MRYCVAEVIAVDFHFGQELSFWNKRTQSVDKLVVTALSGDGIGFQFIYNDKLYKCRFDRAAYKLYELPTDVPEYRRQLQLEHDKWCDAHARAQLYEDLHSRQRSGDYPLSADVALIGGD